MSTEYGRGPLGQVASEAVAEHERTLHDSLMAPVRAARLADERLKRDNEQLRRHVADADRVIAALVRQLGDGAASLTAAELAAAPAGVLTWTDPDDSLHIRLAEPREYRVAWVVDVQAVNAQEAAVQARRMQLDPDSTATVFDCYRGKIILDPGTYGAERIDLEEWQG